MAFDTWYFLGVSLIETSCANKINNLQRGTVTDCSGSISAMFSSLRHLACWLLSEFGSRKDLVFENLALRQQLLALHNPPRF
jgi:hypothetical protein